MLLVVVGGKREESRLAPRFYPEDGDWLLPRWETLGRTGLGGWKCKVWFGQSELPIGLLKAC